MNEKIKIIYIVNSFVLGGAENMLLHLCRAINKEKFEIFVCSVNGGGILASEFEKIGIKPKIFKKKSKIGLSVIWEIYKFIKEVKPQIVHTHLFAADFWGKIAAILAGVPVIVTTEHSVNLDENWLKQKIKWFLSFFTDKIVAVSNGVRYYYIQKVKINKDKFEVIYNGVNLNTFAFKVYKPLDLTKKINAVIVARLKEVKGHKYLLEAMPLIIKKYPNFILNIVGGGDLGLELKELVNKLGLVNNVNFLGERLDIEKIFPDMDIFILPSLWEGLGIVLLEAQASGLAVLTSNIPGTIEVVKNEQTGLLFETKNSQAIFNCVDNLLSHPDLHKKIVENAYEQVKEKFSLEKMVGSYEQLYFDLLKTK
ncbi:glycosyltransferase [Candidatus Falkowbacteria bacterium]|nr:glycosyltransferase [Candidatus Falkowbacteria bacterium]